MRENYKMLVKVIYIDIITDADELIKERRTVKHWLCHIGLIIITAVYMTCLLPLSFYLGSNDK